MRDPRLDGGPYFVPSELHRESDRFVERFKIGVHRRKSFSWVSLKENNPHDLPQAQ
jgi:hypothetical protein